MAARLPGQRADLSRAQVLDTAWELVVDQGAAALTMRALAGELGVQPNTLYSHVDDKDALIDAMLDRVLGQAEAPTPDVRDPVDGLADLMTSSYDALVAHPDLVPRFLDRQGSRGPFAQRLGEVAMTLLARAGVDNDDAATEALRVLIVHTIGFAAFAVAAPFGLPTTPADDPTTVAATRRASFRRSLGWLIAGIVGAND